MSNPPTDDSLESAPYLQTDRAYSSPAAWLRFLVPAVVGLAADLWIKAWAFPNGVIDSGRYPAGDPQRQHWFLDHVVQVTTTVNRGAVFGTFPGMVNWFIPFSVIALIIILWVFLTSRKNQLLVHITLGMITAGAIGNFYDRAIYHGVRDMFKFNVSWYPYIFNIADVLLCVAVPLLMVRWLFTKDHQKPD